MISTTRSGALRKVPRPRKADFTELEGTPDIVVEIVSDSSVRKDTKLLRDAYARAGVPEYWLIDARGSAIQFEILRLMGRKYVSPRSATGPQMSATEGRFG